MMQTMLHTSLLPGLFYRLSIEELKLSHAERVCAYDQDQNNIIIADYDKKKLIKSSTRRPIKP